MFMIDLEWFLAVIYCLGGLNDLFLDLVFLHQALATVRRAGSRQSSLCRVGAALCPRKSCRHPHPRMG